MQIRFGDGREPVTVGKTARYPLKKGDVARLITESGGGWDDPEERDCDLVIADLRAELISESQARDIYGLTDAKIVASGKR